MDVNDDWDKLFDKSKATKVPAEFPGNAKNLALELEDVNEEITDELEEKGTSNLQQPPNQEHPAEPRLSVAKHQNGGTLDKRTSAVENSTQKQTQYFHTSGVKKTSLFLDGKDITDGKDTSKCRCKHKQRGDEGATKDVAESEKVSKAGLENAESLMETLRTRRARDKTDFGTSGEKITEGTTEHCSEPNQESSMSENLENDFQMEDLPIEKDRWRGELISTKTATELKVLLFGSAFTQFGERFYKKCIVLGMSDILWQAGGEKSAVVCLPCIEEGEKIKLDLKQDSLTEKLQLFEFETKDEMERFLMHNISHFEDDDKYGCILFVYSTILSRSTQKVKEDINDANNCLLDSVNSCTQSLINLLLVGRATQFVFNNAREVIQHDDTVIEQHGMSKRSEIGFLSAEEVENPKNYAVGSMLKTPIWPIWVASFDNHFCILFCKKRNLTNDWKLERRFDIFYFAGILRHFRLLKADIMLTIDTMLPYNPDDYEDEDRSLLEDTIRTKWPDCAIDWNGDHRF
eukprot:gene11029-12193_t